MESSKKYLNDADSALEAAHHYIAALRLNPSSAGYDLLRKTLLEALDAIDDAARVHFAPAPSVSVAGRPADEDDWKEDSQAMDSPKYSPPSPVLPSAVGGFALDVPRDEEGGSPRYTPLSPVDDAETEVTEDPKDSGSSRKKRSAEDLEDPEDPEDKEERPFKIRRFQISAKDAAPQAPKVCARDSNLRFVRANKPAAAKRVSWAYPLEDFKLDSADMPETLTTAEELHDEDGEKKSKN